MPLKDSNAFWKLTIQVKVAVDSRCVYVLLGKCSSPKQNSETQRCARLTNLNVRYAQKARSKKTESDVSLAKCLSPKAKFRNGLPFGEKSSIRK